MSNPGAATTSNSALQNVSSNQAIRLLAVAKGVDCNKTGDVVMPVIASSNYSVSNAVFVNASTSLTTAAGGLFSSPAAAGTAIVANAAMSGSTGPTVVVQRTVASTTVRTSPNLYFNIGTAQGAAATIDIYIYGYDFS